MTKPAYTPEFEKFWGVYPRKTAKVNAFKAWQKQLGDGDLFDDTHKVVVADCEKRTRMNWWPADKSKIPHGATWINQRRWEDEGWEDDVRTRGKEHDDQPGYIARPPPSDPPLNLTWGEVLLGRVFFAYCAGTLSPVPSVEAALKERRVVLSDWVPAFLEDVEAGVTDKTAAAREIASLFLKRLDAAYGRSSHDRVMSILNRQRWERAA